MLKILIRTGSFVLCVALFACTLNNNTSVPPAPSNPPPVIATYTSPVGDSEIGGFTHTPPGGGTPYAWDVSRVQSQRVGPPGTTYTELIVSISFEHPDGTPDNSAFAALPGPGQSGVFGINLTGDVVINVGGSSGVSVSCFDNLDFDVDVGIGFSGPINADDTANIVNSSATVVGKAKISGGGSVVNITIPISAIGGSSGGPFNVATVWGTGDLANDCVPPSYFSDSNSRVPMGFQAPPPGNIQSMVPLSR